jgi:phosphoenolpyruvate synthase/pyruvate phosphate dikinase
MAKWVYSFGDGKAEGRADMRNLLGGKGANLAEMSSLGLPVPPGFTITTAVCTHYYANSQKYPKETTDPQSNIIEDWSMSWWGFEKGKSVMMIIIENSVGRPTSVAASMIERQKTSLFVNLTTPVTRPPSSPAAQSQSAEIPVS